MTLWEVVGTVLAVLLSLWFLSVGVRLHAAWITRLRHRLGVCSWCGAKAVYACDKAEVSLCERHAQKKMGSEKAIEWGVSSGFMRRL